MARLCLLGCSLFALGVPARAEQPREPGERVKADVTADADVDADEVRELIARLDAEQFSERNEATRQLLARGSKCIPLLVASLGEQSRETRFRVAGLLRHRFTFDEIAPPLMDAVGKPYGSEVRAILRDRALLQVDEAGEMENTQTLFAFWGTDVETMRKRVLFDLVEARGREQIAPVVFPLVGLRDKAQQFDSLLSRLKALSLPFDHRHSPGYVVAATLAEGLLEGNQKQVAFAGSYVESFEALAAHMQAEDLARSAVRKEIADRANMSDGATGFLVQLLDDDSRENRVLRDQLGVSPQMVQREFFRGLAEREAKECYRCVGKVHIADMLLEALQEWPAALDDALVRNVVDCIVATISSGDKPKALALLDAVEGCAELEQHQLNIHQGLGQRLARRLCLAAQIAPNSRAYHPVRSIHEKIVNVIDLGIQPDDELFPTLFVSHYLEGNPQANSEQARMQLGRYVRMIEQLEAAGASRQQTNVRRFLLLMSRSLREQPELLEAGAAETTRLLNLGRQESGIDPRQAINDALGNWIERVSAAPDKG